MYCQCGCGQITPIAKKTYKRFGYVKGQHYPYASRGHYKANNQKSPTEHFWERVDKREPQKCWNWMAGIDGSGYGIMSYGSTVNNTDVICKAHRFSYEIHFGPIPPEMKVLHKCDNPKCVNPNHLWVGTQLQNVQDMLSKGRGRWSKFNDRP